MLINRKIAPKLRDLSQKFPVLGILGPRQSGKTTLAKMLFPHHKYLNLEELDTRQFATEDPRRFLNSLLSGPGAILDEIQKAPDLLSYIQAHVDEWQTPGFFILTGSQNILLNQHISQTLAGRIAITTLLPLSFEELQNSSQIPDSMELTLFQGFYPSIYSKKIAPSDWVPNYIQTYVERDVRELKQITDLSAFQKFIKLCAGRIGQILDFQSLANDCGISANTVRSWISVLEASYIIFLIHPHFKNFSKRLIKAPKLYFYDTGIACNLLNIRSPEELSMHYLRGGLFESMILSDLLKQRYNGGLQPNIYFWRDKSGLEIDCILDHGSTLTPIEIKSGETIHSDFFSGLIKWNALAQNNPTNSYVIYGGNERQERSNGTILGWNQTHLLPIMT